MGVEVYGLIGVFMSLNALLSLLDMGLTATLSLELPRLSGANGGREARNLVRTFERVYWVVGLLIFVLVTVLATPIAVYWIDSTVLPTKTIETALVVMGASFAVQWPGGLYSGGLMGLQRQVQLNTLRVAMVTLQHAGTVGLLLLVSPSILVYFWWQAAVGLLTTIVLGIALWRALPADGAPARFSRELLVKHWHFTTGVTGISLVSILLTQADKVILSKILTLEAFGYYMLAFNIANVLVTLVNPIYTALFPRFSQLVALEDQKGLSALYHKGCQLAALIVLPVAATVALFSQEVLGLWIRDPIVVANTHLLLSLMVVGNAINAMMTLPYALMLGFGWTRLVFIQNTVSAALLVPMQYWFAVQYGAEGAALVWIALNMGYLFVQIPIMHRRVLKDEMWRWYRFDFMRPAVAAVAIAVGFRLAQPAGLAPYASAGWILMAGLCSVATLMLLMATIRKHLLWLFLRQRH